MSATFYDYYVDVTPPPLSNNKFGLFEIIEKLYPKIHSVLKVCYEPPACVVPGDLCYISTRLSGPDIDIQTRVQTAQWTCGGCKYLRDKFYLCVTE